MILSPAAAGVNVFNRKDKERRFKIAEITDCGYMGKGLRVNQAARLVSQDVPEEATLKKYLRGTGLAIKYLYDEGPPGVNWSQILRIGLS